MALAITSLEVHSVFREAAQVPITSPVGTRIEKFLQSVKLVSAC